MPITLPGDKEFEKRPSIERKALKINLNDRIYGTFAEIGAGQEVARHFFRVGGASGTIAKTISAYDKNFWYKGIKSITKMIEELESL